MLIETKKAVDYLPEKSMLIRNLPELIYKPDLPTQMTYSSYEVYGFGWGVIIGDFKVVVIKGFSFCLFISINSWKYCRDLAKKTMI